MANNKDIQTKLQTLISDLRIQKQLQYAKLNEAIAERELIASSAMPKAEILQNLFSAIDYSAEQFQKTMQSIVSGIARKRHGTGVNRSPELIREVGNYSQLNIDSINYFMGDVIKEKLIQYVDEMPWPGPAQNGIDDDEYYRQLKIADAKVDKLKAEYDEIENQIMSVLDRNQAL